MLVYQTSFGQSIYYETLYDLNNRNISKKDQKNISEIIGFSSPAVKAINQSNIYEGITKFVIEQFKTDLVDIYLERFEKRINEIGELKFIFNETFSVLDNFNQIATSDLGNQVRSAFYKDLYLLPSRISESLENPEGLSIKNKFLSETNIKNFKLRNEYKYLKIALDLFDKLLNNYHPQNILEYLALKDGELGVPGQVLKALNYIQGAFRDSSKIVNGQLDNVWINFEQLNKINTNEGKEKFVELLSKLDSKLFEELVILSNQNSVNSFFTKCVSILELCQSLQELGRQTNQGQRNYIGYINLVCKLVKTTELLFKNVEPEFSDILQHVGGLYSSIGEGKFDLVFSNSCDIINIIFPSANEVENWVKLQGILNKYISFSVAMINAKNSDEVKDVIKNHVKVNANRTLKRNSSCGMTLNFNPGLIYGVENYSEGPNKKLHCNYGLTLPIGFEFYFNWPGKKPGSGNISKNVIWSKGTARKPSTYYSSISISFLDLGAFLNYGLGKSPWDNLVTKEEISFLSVFSPGLTINQSLGKVPITVGIAYRYTPKLRKLTEEVYPRANQFSVGVYWDIPVISIFNKSYVRRRLN